MNQHFPTPVALNNSILRQESRKCKKNIAEYYFSPGRPLLYSRSNNSSIFFRKLSLSLFTLRAMLSTHHAGAEPKDFGRHVSAPQRLHALCVPAGLGPFALRHRSGADLFQPCRPSLSGSGFSMARGAENMHRKRFPFFSVSAPSFAQTRLPSTSNSPMAFLLLPLRVSPSTVPLSSLVISPTAVLMVSL